MNEACAGGGGQECFKIMDDNTIRKLTNFLLKLLANLVEVLLIEVNSAPYIKKFRGGVYVNYYNADSES